VGGVAAGDTEGVGQGVNLDAFLGPQLVAAIERLVDERVAQAVAGLRVPEPLSPWLTVRQAAEMLGCSEAAVRMRINRERLEARRQGRRVYVSRASLVALGPVTTHWVPLDEQRPRRGRNRPRP
jgi:excisionase family DNA binding protein